MTFLTIFRRFPNKDTPNIFRILSDFSNICCKFLLSLKYVMKVNTLKAKFTVKDTRTRLLYFRSDYK